MGSLAAWFHEKKGRDFFSEKTKNIIIIISLFALISFTVAAKKGVFGSPANFLMDKQFIFGVILSILLYASISSEGLGKHLFGSVWLSAIGRWSYPIYLFHWMIVLNAKQIFSGYSAVFISIIGSIILGWLIHKLIEDPIYSLRRQISKKIT